MEVQKSTMVWKFGILGWGILLLVGILLGLLFYDGLQHMVGVWEKKEEYSHGFLIPLISIFFIWQKKDQLELRPYEGAWSGVFLLLFGLALYFVGELSALYIIIQYAFLIAIYGGVIALIGWKGARIIWAPLLFLVFMIPLPDFLYQGLSARLQLISSEIGVAVIRLFGISVYLEGNVIDLGSFKLQVVEACSGLRYLFPLTSLAFLMAYIFQAPLWKRAIVFFSSIPITIFMNSFRIGVIGVLVEYWGPSQAEGFLHDFEGWVVFMACLSILLLEMWVLTKIGGSRQSLGEAFSFEFPEPAPEGAETRLRNVPASFFASGAMLVVALTLAANLGERSEITPERKLFSEFLMDVGEWRGKRSQLERIYLDLLKLDDYIIVDYIDGNGGSVNFYAAYYASQSKGESAHSPRSCLPGGGWQIADLTEKTFHGVQVGNGVPLKVNRVVIKKGEYTQLVYYWFQGRGRVITNEYMVKWFLFLDALTKSRTDGALVRLTTFVPPGENLELADKRLVSFVQQVGNSLGTYIPD